MCVSLLLHPAVEGYLVFPLQPTTMSSHGQRDIESFDAKENEKRKEDEERFLMSQSQHDRERGGGISTGNSSISSSSSSSSSGSGSSSSSSSSSSSTSSTSDNRGYILRLLRFILIVFVALALLSLYRVVRSIAEGGIEGGTTVVVTGGTGKGRDAGSTRYPNNGQDGDSAIADTTGTGTVINVSSGSSSDSGDSSNVDSTKLSSDSGSTVANVGDMMQSSVNSPHYDPNAMNREPDLSFIEDTSIEEGKSFDSSSDGDVSAESEAAADSRMAAKSAADAIATAAGASGKSCISKKRIILSVNKCGLGNRMVSLASTVMLALLMDRVVELDWINNRYCSASYSELFHAKPQTNLAHDFRPFIYNPSTPHPSDVKQKKKVCQVYFDQTLNYKHLSFLAEKSLFDRLNEECHVIKIQANIYYAHLLLNDLIGSRLKKTFHLTSPFHHIAQIVFRPDDSKRQMANDFILEHMKGEKWLSIHARGYYDDGSRTDRALECANKLLNTGEISYVYFATETLRLLEKAQKAIPADKLITTPHETIADSAKEREDSMSIRNDMDSAMLDWLLIGSATYCTATIIGQSTFSKTSIVNGPCIYIDYSGDSCSVEVGDTIQGHHKEALMHYENKDKINIIPSVPDKDDQEKIWKSVPIEEEDVVEQCYTEQWPDFADLYKYWGVNEERGMHHHFTHHQGGLKPAPNKWGVPIADSAVTVRQDIPKETKQKLLASRFKNKDTWPSGGFEAAEARRCAMGGCSPGFIEGYKDDPHENHPEAVLHPPAFATANMKKIAEIQAGGKEGKKVLTKNTGAADEEQYASAARADKLANKKMT